MNVKHGHIATETANQCNFCTVNGVCVLTHVFRNCVTHVLVDTWMGLLAEEALSNTCLPCATQATGIRRVHIMFANSINDKLTVINENLVSKTNVLHDNN